MMMLEGWQAKLWTALPGYIDTVDLSKMTCSVQLGIQTSLRDPKGNITWNSPQIVTNVPLIFPNGGGFTLTFPVKRGDEVLVVFSSRCIDSWWVSGGKDNQQINMGMHGVSDGFAIFGPRSQPHLLPSISATTVQLRTEMGDTFVEITDNKVVNIAAPNGVNITGDTVITGDVRVHGAMVVDDEGTFNGGHTVSAHIHGGVQTGGGNTGGPTG